MDRIGKILVELVIAFLLYLLIKFAWKNSSFYNDKEIVYNSSTDTTIIYDTVPKLINSKPVRLVDTFIIEVPREIDTQKIINEYYYAYKIEDWYRDTNIDLTITDSIFQNQVMERKIKYEWLQPKTIINNKTEIRNPHGNHFLFVGAGFNYDIPKGVSLNTSVMYQSSKTAISVGYNPQLKQFNGTYFIKLWQKN